MFARWPSLLFNQALPLHPFKPVGSDGCTSSRRCTAEPQSCLVRAGHEGFLCHPRQRHSCRKHVTCVAGKVDSNATPAPNSDQNVRLKFKLPYRCNFGQYISIVGSSDTLGNWDPSAGKPMQWTDGDVWTVEFELTPGSNTELEYKYVVKNSDGNIHTWKPGNNYLLQLPTAVRAEEVKVKDAWDGSVQDIEFAEPLTSPPREQESTKKSSSEGLTFENELLAVKSAKDRAILELSAAIDYSASVQKACAEPDSPEVLAADRRVAAASNKAIALTGALNTYMPSVRGELPESSEPY